MHRRRGQVVKVQTATFVSSHSNFQLNGLVMGPEVLKKSKQASDIKSHVQWIATFGVFLLMFEVGINIGWASPNLARFASEDSPIQMTTDEISWVLACTGIGGFFGSILFSIGLEFFGGRKIVLVIFIAISLSWIFLIVANSVVWIYIARILGGITCAGSYASFSIYLGEVVQPGIRGTVVAVATGGNALGILVGIVTETYITAMKVSCPIYLVFCVISILLFIWLKDSPYYCAKKGDFKSARKSIAFYFPGCDVEEELKPIQAFVEANANNTLKGKLKQLKEPVVRKSLLIIFIIFGLPHVSGQVNIMSYMEIILKNGKSDLIKPQEFVIYANIISIIATLASIRFSDKFGRKAALIFSSIGCAIGMVCLGIHFFLLTENVDAQSLQWLPIFSIVFYLITYAVGYSPVPSTVLSELFPESIKSLAACFAALGASFFGTIVTKSFQPVVDTFGDAYIFWLHAALSLVTIPCALLLLPETKGKTFQQIQDDLMK
ncbi:facilitated trehalose transporter Tret1 isoform X1 [Nasonia vitripennis]|uniref:Major facilitator superfamily (MFS) profile domain-containing protein n=2 Tax=Nasonia vitripennis TaxID=7425 RepID=A0A7M7QBX1_NASVI|nr:facilitated trehalose transporter Tret1 isoform X1 [Nasonia vitripennis]XP_031783170.1 facilitated trehalose transporter Tret1 isoform X1 [Nasonia vitripennis]